MRNYNKTPGEYTQEGKRELIEQMLRIDQEKRDWLLEGAKNRIEAHLELIDAIMKAEELEQYGETLVDLTDTE